MILCVRAVANSNSKNRGKGIGGGGWTTREVRDPYRLRLWKDIRKGWDKFTLRANIRIGNGRRIRFWWDSWVGKIKLKDVYPTFFRLSSHKNATVADLWGRGGGEMDVGRFVLEDPSKIGSKRSEKSSPRMEIQGTWEEEKSSLAAGSDLLILVYLGRAQPNDLQRRRIVGPKVEGSFFQIPCGVSKLLDLEIPSI
ncbi:hypothetical protein CK203_042921 [Vitis vinifera]|uniref:Reverse transcriptase zinc-binding domain-containing protein n=1 Tax=Vitis vinifera TaxID=29760 RepID=A0A438HUI7_VITVI|nr:hypothetical protein CK203_042921 [Vitis vinifera]